ncbi:uncharacterized protein LOC143514074 [Brachyhypopomus gauderio]|uniref:uncharacterized protein LOC143514074 n=1 Tax=Brachyhypopomus gauderio TaxID=698409 RepID=UPI0040417B28
MQAPEDGAAMVLHCLVPPMRLLSAAMWKLIQQEDVPNYGVLEEFVSWITDNVPDILNHRQRTQLTMGLRARLVLELCGMEKPAAPEMVQFNLKRIQTLLALHKELESGDAQVEESGTNFVALVQTLMKDPAEKSIFFKDVFPLQYGIKFNNALKKLMWQFLSGLENAVPPPTLEETAHILGTAPTVMEECVQSLSQPHQLKNVFKYQREANAEIKEKIQSWSIIPDDCILSCLGSSGLAQEVIEEQTHTDSQSVVDYPPLYCQEVQVESVIIAQYIDNNLETGTCDGDADGVRCFDTDENKRYDLQSTDHADNETSTEIVYEEVESLDLRAVDFALEERSEKQDPLKREVSVEETAEDPPVTEEDHGMAVDQPTGDKSDCPKMELAEENVSDVSVFVSGSARVDGKAVGAQQEGDLSGLVTTYMIKQPCVKIDRLNITGTRFLQPLNPAPRKKGRGRPRKDDENSKSSCEKKQQERPTTVPCESKDEHPEHQNVMCTIIQKLKKTYAVVKEPSMMHACSLCGFQDREEIHVHHHLIVHHPEEYKRLCEAGEEKERSHSDIGTAQSSGNDDKPQTKIRSYRGVPVCRTCPVCEKTFTRSADMRRHQASHTTERPFACLYCGKTFRYTFDLRRHQQHACANQEYVVLDHRSTDEVSEDAKETSPTSSDENALPPSPDKCPPTQPVLGKGDVVFCHVCKMELSNSSSLKSHMETHLKGVSHTCPCGKTYKYLDSMRTHQLVCPVSDSNKQEQQKGDKQDVVKNKEEVMCDDSGAMSQNPTCHVKSADEPDMEKPEAASPSTSVSDPGGIPPVSSNLAESSVCPHNDTPEPTRCLSSVPVVLNRRRHLRSPSGGHPHKCPQCGDSFRYSYNLKKHEDVCEGRRDRKDATWLHSNEHSRPSTGPANDEPAVGVLPGLSLHDAPSADNVDGADGVEQPDCVSDCTETAPEIHLICDGCGKIFKDSSSLKKHKRTCGTNERRYQCVKCGSLFRTLLDVRKHVHMHWGEDPLQCSQCGKSFQSPSELEKHKVAHDRERKYPCTLCPEVCERLESLKHHYLEVHEFKGPYQCSHCDKTHVDLSAICAHVRTHSDERPYQCSHCAKRFKQRSGLNVHEKLHSGDRPFLCEECGKCFGSNIQLQRHSISHSTERPHSCPQCKKRFKSRHALRGHTLKHSKPANVPCEVCGKVFSQASALDRHRRTHTGERPYSCPKCGKTFLSSGEVGKHLRYHTGERPFQCALCSKSFTQACYLSAHMRIHTGERPYVCGDCGKAFVCNTHLKRHTFVHTKEKPFKCDCGKAFNRTNLLKVHKKNQCLLQKK